MIAVIQGSKLLVKIVMFCTLFFLGSAFIAENTMGQSACWLVDSTIQLIDGNSVMYNHVQPGDTIFLKAGNRNKLLIRNFKGNPDKPVFFMNKDGIVSISTDEYYAVSISNCRYIRFSGQGIDSEFYGIQIKKVAAGSGIGIGSMSSDFEIDHISVENCLIGGIYAKTDPDCSLLVSRETFTQFNTSIHDNYIANVGNEGMYIGSSYYSGMSIHCNGKDTVIMPPVLNGVQVYNNILKGTGWDGIQVSSAPLHCRIFNNDILNDSQAEVPNQMSGILIGGGSSCDCNNNLITDGKGDGIEVHGIGGNKIYNNIILRAGKTYLPNDLTQMKHGIFVSDVSVIPDSAFYIFFNDIIDPKSDGIRFQSIKSKHNLLASNLVINPGNYLFYETDNTAFTGMDSYIMIPNTSSDIQLKNNYFSRTITGAGISSADYTIFHGSPLINKAYPDNHFVNFDFRGHPRPVGGMYDIGAMEFDSDADSLMYDPNQHPFIFPNPASSLLTIRYISVDKTNTQFQVHQLSGSLVMQQSNQVVLPGLQVLQISVGKLARGLYIYTLRNGNNISYGKFIKL